MPDLTDYRREIDEIDTRLTQLYERRMDVVLRVAEYKRAQGMPVMQAGRERAVLENAEKRLANPAYAKGVRALFETLMAVSRQAQHDLLDAPCPVADGAAWVLHPRVAYPGAEGAFSEQAAAAFFREQAELKHLPTFEEAAAALSAGKADYAVLPIENSSAGSVPETYDLLLKYRLSIVGEQFVRVAHCLLGVPGASLTDVREIHSHPQAIAQCREFLAAHRDVRIVPSANTALSARMVAETGDKRVAAIAGRRAADSYRLAVLAEDIHTDRLNHTRFVVAARQPLGDAGDKATVTFALNNQVGALSRVIGSFARQGINLSKLESRPIAGRPWEYTFYAELEWQDGRSKLMLALEEAGRDAREMHLLGLYKKAAPLEGLRCSSTD